MLVMEAAAVALKVPVVAPAATVIVSAPEAPAVPTKTSALWSLATVWCATWAKLLPKASVTDTVAPTPTRTPTTIR